jgi:lipoyl-dependent peroxiredoxin
MIRKATAVWRGTGRDGSGALSSDSGALSNTAYSFKTRFENEKGTNPEELIAAAHAACFAMALSNELAKAGNPPDELKTSATVTFQPGEGITRIVLTVKGKVPGMDDEAFREAAEGAKENCPVSKALAGVPEITLDASLA